MFKNFLKSQLTFIVFSLLAFSLFTLPVLAESNQPDLNTQQGDILNQIGNKSGYGSTQSADDAERSIARKIGEVVGMILGFLGVIFLFLVVYSGIQWMTAGGNEERVTKARARIVRATIGLIIVTSAYALSAFVLSKIQPASTNVGCARHRDRLTCDANNCDWSEDLTPQCHE